MIRLVRVQRGTVPVEIVQALAKGALSPTLEVLLAVSDPAELPADLSACLAAIRSVHHGRCGITVGGCKVLSRDVIGRIQLAAPDSFEVAFSVLPQQRFDKAAGTGAFRSLVESFASWRRELDDPRMIRPLRRPRLELRARVALDARSVPEPDLTGAIAKLTGALHRVALELWPRRNAHGHVRLPDFSRTASVLTTLFEKCGGQYAQGVGSVGFVGTSGLPLCLLHGRPEFLPAFRLRNSDAKTRDPDSLAEACAKCTLAPWCAPAGTGLRAGEPLQAWVSHLISFAAVPPSLHHLVRAEAIATSASEEHLHQPGVRPITRAEFDAFHVDAHLWGGGYARFVTEGGAALQVARVGPAPRVVLVRVPGFKLDERECSTLMPPLSLIQLGSMLTAEGLPQRVADLAAEAQVAGLLAEEGPAARLQVIDFTARRIAELAAELGGMDALALSAESPDGARLAGEVAQSIGTPALTVMGGRGIELGDDLLQEFPALDLLVEQEGDVAFALLLRHLAQGIRLPRSVPGTCFRTAGGLARLPAAYQELDAVAPPSLHWVDAGLYPDTRQPFEGELAVPYQFVLGCPYHCAFCGDYSAGRMRMRSPARVVSDVTRMFQEHGVRNFVFLNTLINPTPRYVEELLTEFERLPMEIRWVDSAKPRLLDSATLNRLRRAGCVQLIWGIDAASPRLCKLYAKGFDLEDATTQLRLSHEAGISNVVNLIAGLPHESDEDRTEISKWLVSVQGIASYVNIMPYRLMGNSLIYRFPERYGIARRLGTLEAYDELGGLKWEAKQEAANAETERLARLVAELGFARTTKGTNF